VCGVSKLLFNAKPRNKIYLIHKLKVVMGSLERGTVAKAYYSLMSRIEAVVATNSHFIK
jgi:hypothetical protein